MRDYIVKLNNQIKTVSQLDNSSLDVLHQRVITQKQNGVTHSTRNGAHVDDVLFRLEIEYLIRSLAITG